MNSIPKILCHFCDSCGFSRYFSWTFPLITLSSIMWSMFKALSLHAVSFKFKMSLSMSEYGRVWVWVSMSIEVGVFPHEYEYECPCQIFWWVWVSMSSPMLKWGNMSRVWVRKICPPLDTLFYLHFMPRPWLQHGMVGDVSRLLWALLGNIFDKKDLFHDNQCVPPRNVFV